MPKLTNTQVQEYIKCRKDPIYFLRTYATIRHPTRGLLRFDLWDFQEDCVKSFLSNSYNIVLKARQLGLSTLVAGYIAWMMIFFRDKEIFVLAIKRDTAQNMIDKVRVVMSNLPEWIQCDISTDNKQSIRLRNGSVCKASGTTKDGIRSEALSLLVIDEAAFIDKLDDIWVSAQPTLSTGGDCIALSTPNGMGNWFHQMWSEAEAGQQQEVGGRQVAFNPIKLHWSNHPERDQAWADSMASKMSKQAFAQEHDADFLSSGSNVVDMEDIMWYEHNPEGSPYCCEPLEKTGFDRGLWVFKYPDYNRDYMVTADVARGDGKDYSAAHIFDIETNEQVACYRGKVPTDVFGHMLVQMAVQYNNALLIVENNNVGWATIQKIIDLNYSNLYWTDKSRTFVDVTRTRDIMDVYDRSKNHVPGFTTGQKVRPVVIARMEEEIRGRGIILHDKRTISELKTFIYDDTGKPVAMDGYNDDLVISLAIHVFVRSTNLKIHAQGGEITKTLLSHMSFTNQGYDYGVIPSKSAAEKAPHDQYAMRQPDGSVEDLTRWLI